jgi:hypothetical protein
MKAKVSGFSFIKNGISLGYPFIEAVKSIAPLCDEIIINVGFDTPTCDQDDGTLALIENELKDLNPKIIKSFWDPLLTSQGLVLSQQTNIALDACQHDIAFYIQGDEVVHEEDYHEIKNGIERMNNDSTIEGLIFNYLHFYGSINSIMHTRRVYKREVRIIRKLPGLKSHLDAQGFRFEDGHKPLSIPINARIFHYGWARKETVMRTKAKAMDKLYHGKDFEGEKEFAYERIWGLKAFKETHPRYVKDWIESHKNSIDLLSIPYHFKWKDVNLMISDAIECLTGYRIGEHKGFKLK